MNVVFRVDASVRMGTGHLMRCLTLAETLRSRGVQVRFICREHTGNLVTLLQQKALPVTMLPAPEIDLAVKEDYGSWLGVTQAQDAQHTIEALKGEKPDWLVVDHYGLDVEWEHILRPNTRKLMVIDDLANRHHDCDVLLDQNFSANDDERYEGLLPKSCKLMLGPRYALLRPEYIAHRKTASARGEQVRQVLVFFGGSDPENMTGLALEALSDEKLKHLKVDVVVGANSIHKVSLENKVKLRPLTRVFGARPHLADLMSRADLAIGGCGTTTWERMCLGLPTVVVSVAENQRPASEALKKAKLIHYAGHFTDIKIDHLKSMLKTLIKDEEGLLNLSLDNQLHVDGLGVHRLVEVMSPSDSREIQLRSASDEDKYIYFNWANDREVRCNSFDTAPISWVNHQAWFTRKLSDINSWLFVLEAAGLPVGQVRFDRNGNEAFIDYSLDSIVRGRGWGAQLVAMGADLMQKIEPSLCLRAEVKAGNEASSSTLLRIGFTEIPNKFDSRRLFLRKPR